MTAAVWLVGHGNVARHARPWLEQRGLRVESLGARALAEGTASLPRETPLGLWLLARDRDLLGLAKALVPLLAEGGVETAPVLHAAGARLAREVLAPLAEAGHPVGTLHPICSLRKELASSRLDRASFGVGGDPPAVAFARRLAGDQPVLDLGRLDARGRMAYHAACALAANHLAVLIERSGAVLRGQGHDAPTVERALEELMLSSLENLAGLGIPAGVTGPLVRDDRETIEAHLAALDDAETRELYRGLSERLARLLAARG